MGVVIHGSNDGFFSLQLPALVGFPLSHILLFAWADRITM
jgi:hypothetical protein